MSELDRTKPTYAISHGPAAVQAARIIASVNRPPVVEREGGGDLSQYSPEDAALIRQVQAEHEAQSGNSRLWGWFGLSRAAWLTMPRVLMHEMPDEWQKQMAVLLEQFDDAFPSWVDRQFYVTAKKDGKYTELPEALCNYRRPMLGEIAEMRVHRSNLPTAAP